MVSKCFLAIDRPVGLGLFSRGGCENTTAGIRPWALSFAEILFPVNSLGIAWMVWYREAWDWRDGCEAERGFDRSDRRPPPAERHHFTIFWLLLFSSLGCKMRVLCLLCEGFKALGLYWV